MKKGGVLHLAQGDQSDSDHRIAAILFGATLHQPQCVRS